MSPGFWVCFKIQVVLGPVSLDEGWAEIHIEEPSLRPEKNHQRTLKGTPEGTP